MAIERMDFWKGLVFNSRIFLAAEIESVTTVILQMLLLSRAGIRLRRIDINSASIGIMFIACRLS